LHFGANAGRADARRRDAGDAVFIVEERQRHSCPPAAAGLGAGSKV